MRVVIVDDEPLARDRLRALLAQVPDVELVAEAGDGQAALQACAEHSPDAVLMDIAMPGIDGLEAARHLASFEPRPAVIFCTAYDAHALSAFEAAAVDYLVKPVRAERLAAALERARIVIDGQNQQASESEQGQRRTHLCARLRGNLRLIPIEDVLFLRAEEKYVAIYHSSGEDLLEESLKSLEDEFGDTFVRIHRNCLVSRAEIAGLRRNGDGQTHVQLRRSPQTLEVSRRCLPQLKDLLKHM